MPSDGMLYKRVENDKAQLSVYYSGTDASPREDCTVGRFYTWLSRYNSPDKHDFATPKDFLIDLASNYVEGSSKLDKRSVESLLKLISKHVIILSVYKHEHGSIKYTTGGSLDAWGSTQAGWTYVTKEDIKASRGLPLITKTVSENIKQILRDEVEDFSNYANGSVFYSVLEEKIVICQDGECTGNCTCGSEDTVTEFNVLERSGGFYGSNFKTNGMLAELGYEYEDLINQL